MGTSRSTSFTSLSRTLRYDLTQNDVSIKRVKAIKFAYNALDNEGKGFLDYAEMKAKFVAAEHPLVRTKQLTAEQILTEFETNMGSKV